VCLGVLASAVPARVDAADFVRGDCNADGLPGGGNAGCDLADPIFLLNSLFLGGQPPVCAEACDANDDGGLHVADAVYMLIYCFIGGAPPAAPFPECGRDPDAWTLGCREFPPCAGPTNPCVRQSAEGVGPCDAILGFKYDGRRCIGISGCECEGEDCDDLYDSFDECERATSRCVPRCMPMDAHGVGECLAVLGVVFDGEQCVALSGCDCEGADCDLLYDTMDECEAVHGECPGVCAPMDVTGVGACRVVLGWYFDGADCQPLSACECEGPDCDLLYDSLDECERVTRQCASDDCAPFDATGEGPCDRFFGYKWDGSACVGVSGCDCVGPDCDRLYDRIEECERVHADCLDPCAPQDARGEGACDMLLGWAWNGTECVALSGCECVGEDCDELYESPAECERAHVDCWVVDCDPMQARGVGACALVLGVVWTGRECVTISGCDCEGPDCDELYDSMDECVDDHEGCVDICDPMDVAGEGPCDAVLGAYWNGFECRELSGCECVGEDCDELYDSMAECWIQRGQFCPPTCSPMRVRGVGDCEMILGYYWNGGECVALVGCECDGPDCGRLSSIELCRTSHVRCPEPCVPMDVREVGDCEPIHGWYWNGTRCEALSGCECAGEDCDRLFASLRECLDVTAGCPRPEEED